MRTPTDAVTGESQNYSEFRPLMFSIAYRMVGQVNDAEDIVQEAFISFYRAASREEISSQKAFPLGHGHPAVY